ncbi:MAG: hypothetical protein AB8F78_10575 [Saprospiraceae bacterium]
MRLSQFFSISLLFVAMLLTSCGTFTEEVWINADGSGRYKLDYDAAESLAMLEMMGNMGGEEDTNKSDSDNPEDVMKDALAQEKFDTTFNLMTVMPDSVKQIIGNKKALRQSFADQGKSISDNGIDSLQTAFGLLKNLDFAMRMDKGEGILGFGMTINFDNATEVGNTFRSMDALKAMDAESSQASGMADKMGNRTTFELVGKNKLIVRQAPAAKMDEILDAAGDNAEGMDAAQIEQMLEMMGLSSYQVKVHVPGLVKSVTGADYVKENDNTVVLSINYLEAMKGGELMEAEITFKPKKKMRLTVPK